MTINTKEIVNNSKVLTFDRELLEEFKEIYNEVIISEENKSFIFYDNEFNADYAKYLIEYLEPLL